MLKSFKYELNPTDSQKRMLSQAFGCARFMYNWALDRKTKEYKEGNKVSCFQLSAELTELKKQEEFKWLNEVYSQTLQKSLSILDTAFTRFFKGLSAFPKFKKKRSRQSAHFPSGTVVNTETNLVQIPKVGLVKYYRNKPIKGIIKCSTISKTPTNRYFISITCETGDPIPPKSPIKSVVGIDLGIKNFAVTSDKEVFENQKYLNRSLKRLRVESRKFSRCKKDSKNREKQRLIVASLYEKITNQREDFQHKLSTYLINKYDAICLETLDIKQMMLNKHLSRLIADSAWYSFVQKLLYKANWYGKTIVQIGQFVPSSKMCSKCGTIKSDLKLSDRVWECKHCHTINERDFNAAINIKDFGQRALALNVNAEH